MKKLLLAMFVMLLVGRGLYAAEPFAWVEKTNDGYVQHINGTTRVGYSTSTPAGVLLNPNGAVNSNLVQTKEMWLTTSNLSTPSSPMDITGNLKFAGVNTQGQVSECAGLDAFIVGVSSYNVQSELHFKTTGEGGRGAAPRMKLTQDGSLVMFNGSATDKIIANGTVRANSIRFPDDTEMTTYNGSNFSGEQVSAFSFSTDDVDGNFGGLSPAGIFIVGNLMGDGGPDMWEHVPSIGLGVMNQYGPSHDGNVAGKLGWNATTNSSQLSEIAAIQAMVGTVGENSAAGTLQFRTYDELGSNDVRMVIESDGKITVGRPSYSEGRVNVEGSVKADSYKFSDGTEMTTASSGGAGWDYTATQDIDMAGFNLNNADGVVAHTLTVADNLDPLLVNTQFLTNLDSWYSDGNWEWQAGPGPSFSGIAYNLLAEAPIWQTVADTLDESAKYRITSYFNANGGQMKAKLGYNGNEVVLSNGVPVFLVPGNMNQGTLYITPTNSGSSLNFVTLEKVDFGEIITGNNANVVVRPEDYNRTLTLDVWGKVKADTIAFGDGTEMTTAPTDTEAFDPTKKYVWTDNQTFVSSVTASDSLGTPTLKTNTINTQSGSLLNVDVPAITLTPYFTIRNMANYQHLNIDSPVSGTYTGYNIAMGGPIWLGSNVTIGDDNYGGGNLGIGVSGNSATERLEVAGNIKNLGYKVITSTLQFSDGTSLASTSSLATASSVSSETSARQAADTAIGITTGTIQSNLTAETASRIAGDNAIGVSTGSILSALNTEVALQANIHTVTEEPTGFENSATSTLSLSGSTFQIAGTNFPIWIKGAKVLKNTETISISNTGGLHWIYYTNTVPGVLTESTTPPGFDYPLVASVIWSTQTASGIVYNERHGITMDYITHEYLHDTVGLRYASGLSGTFDNTSSTVTAGEFFDEDNQYTPSQQTTMRVFYKNGTNNFVWTAPQTAPHIGVLYNNGVSTATVTLNNFWVVWVFATNDTSNPILSVLGQRIDTSIANAQTNNVYGSLLLPPLELKLLYRVIYKNVGGVSTWQQTDDYRAVSSLPAGGTFVATQHSSLAGLDLASSGHPYDVAGGFASYNGLASLSIAPTQLAAGTYNLTTSTFNVASISSSGQVTSNGRKLVDTYDFTVNIATPYALGTSTYTVVFPFKSDAVHISTMTVRCQGGTNCVVNFTKRDRNLATATNGTAMFTGNITATDAAFIGGTLSDGALPAWSGVAMKVISISGDVYAIEINGTYTKD